MRKVISILFFFVSVSFLDAEKLTTLPDVFSPMYTAADKDNLYISDQHRVLVYYLDSLKMRFALGRKGDGPGEFRATPQIVISADEIIIFSGFKFSRFSKKGRFLDEKRLPIKMLQNIMPVKKDYVIFFKKIDEEGCYINEINICDQNLKRKKSLFLKKSKKMTDKKLSLINHFVFFHCWSDKIFLANSHKGFCIDVFGLDGNLIYTIKKDYEKIEVTEAFKSKTKRDFIKRFDIRLHKQIPKMFEFEFPKYFPAIKDFMVVDDKIYVKTFGSRDDKEEYIIMNLKGIFIKKIYLPKTVKKCYSIKNDKFYYLKENEEEEEWELHSIVIN